MALSNAQLDTFKADILANTDPAVVAALAAGADNAIAEWYNQTASPAFWVWKNDVTTDDVGRTISLKDLGNITTANSDRLNTAFTLYSQGEGAKGFSPSTATTRAFFADMFSGAAGAATRPLLLSLWQRTTNYIEKLFATGTGTQGTGEINGTSGQPDAGSPATLVFEGTVSSSDVRAALNRP